MEKEKVNTPEKEKKISESSVSTTESSSTTLEDNKELGIDNKESIDKDSAHQTDKLTKETVLTEELKLQIKELFKADFDNSVRTQKEEIKKEGQEIKKDFLTIFGLFASFVTFLSIEVQVFKNKDNVLELIGISSISLSFVMFFALVINDIAKDKSEWKDFLKPTYIFNLFFAVVGIIFLYIGGTSSISRLDIIERQSNSDSTIINSQKVEIQTLNKKVETLDSFIKISSKPKQTAPTNDNENKPQKN